ncbi:hypothetical protein [Lentzea kentuckyensis]|uniref:hypothetical protein n=1 Tax=Lentzea kentuckyensis TaxID=360086 RepID=UPI000A36530D|nr:hypothetical protein [Lentzea kentuckyensis]
MVREDDLRATFSALHAEGAPPRATTAADLIQRGQAVRSRRRTIAVVGSGLATVGVVAVALAVLPAATPPEPATPPGPASTTWPVPTNTTPPPSSMVSTPTTVTPPSGPQSSNPDTPPVGTSLPPVTTSTPVAPPSRPNPTSNSVPPASTTPSTPG